MAVRLIVSADDFGASREINAAVARGFREGILTCAGLMVTGDALDDAVSLAGSEPGLAVGLHLALSSTRSVLGFDSIPSIVDDEARFAQSPVRAALRYYVSARARAALCSGVSLASLTALR